MRKIILNLAATLDGFIEGPKGELDWCILDDDMGLDTFLAGIDSIFYGRVSYDLWGNYQPEPSATDTEKDLYASILSKQKYVFSSHNRQDANATFITADIVKRIEEIKKAPGKDIWLYGGAQLITTFIENGLIDVYMIAVHPTVLGAGKPLFDNMVSRLSLKLMDAKVFKSGVVQLIYGRA